MPQLWRNTKAFSKPLDFCQVLSESFLIMRNQQLDLMICVWFEGQAVIEFVAMNTRPGVAVSEFGARSSTRFPSRT